MKSYTEPKSGPFATQMSPIVNPEKLWDIGTS